MDTKPQKTCAVYLDGFNAYNGIFKFRPDLKWLNFRSFFEAICAPYSVEMIYYCTAMVTASTAAGLEQSKRQQTYIKALKSLPKFKVVLGTFQNKLVTCQKCYGEYSYPQEKKTDVNIALNMMVDAMERKYDSMVLVSCDSDLNPVCKWIKDNRPEIGLLVYFPILPELKEKRKNDSLSLMAIKTALLPCDELHKHQFSDPLKLSFGSISKPVEWA